MSQSKPAGILSDLKDFRGKLEAFLAIRKKMLEGKQLEEKEIESVHRLYNDIGLRVGEFAPLISELAGTAGAGREAGNDKWDKALSTSPDPLVVRALDECVRATARAVVRLEKEIRAGKRGRSPSWTPLSERR